MFTKTAIISALAGLAVAAPAMEKRDSNQFAATAFHSESDIQASSIQANGNQFFIGKPSSAYCPEGVSGLDCSNCMNLLLDIHGLG